MLLQPSVELLSSSYLLLWQDRLSCHFPPSSFSPPPSHPPPFCTPMLSSSLPLLFFSPREPFSPFPPLQPLSLFPSFPSPFHHLPVSSFPPLLPPSVLPTSFCQPLLYASVCPLSCFSLPLPSPSM